MKEIFLGFAFDKEKAEEMLKNSRVGLQTAANQYQLGFLEGICRPIEILSVLPVGAFPFGNTKARFQKSESETRYGRITYLPFVNIFGLKDLSQQKSIYRVLSKMLSDAENATLYVYGLYMPFLNVLRKLRKKHLNLRICLIIPDLPGKYGIMRKAYTLGGLRDRYEAERKLRLAENADSYVLLTEKMSEALPKKPYKVIEGFLPEDNFDYSNKREPKTILYTGSLNSAFGIDKLLLAFEQITDPDYKLLICGAGGIQSTVEEYAKKDGRITYLGFLPKEKIADLQTRCDILINPRAPHGEYTKYSFPSKTMEYLLSGSKVLMYRLPGVPEEYFKYIYEINGESPSEIADSIMTACADVSFDEKRRHSQIDWIKSEKNSKKQIKKLMEFLDEI